MRNIDNRFVLIASDGDRLYPYKKLQKETNRFGFALTAPGEQDRHGGGTYTEDINLVVKKLVFENWSVRVTTIDKEGKQREGTLGIGKKSIVGYELDSSLQHLINGAHIRPQNIIGTIPIQNKSPISIDNTVILDEEKESAVDEYSYRAIKTRRGQQDFRKSLLLSFSAKCCISNCTVESVLEAAHIIPHTSETNYKITNGILLRADLHTLFDLNLIGIDTNGIVHVSEKLKYSEYAEFDGLMIASHIPEEMSKNLSSRFNEFQKIENNEQTKTS